MQKTQMIIQEIEKLVGSDVVIFGQVEKIEEASPFHIRVVDVLKQLKPFEVTDLEMESIDEYLEYLDDVLGLKKVMADNTVNWNAPIDHHFNYKIYQDQVNDRYLIELAVHRYGEIRAICNYTDSVLYSFEHIDDFFATVAQAGYYKPIGKYYLEACPLQEGWRLYDEEGYLLEELFDEEDILERL